MDNALDDLFQTAKQLRSFGFTGDLHIPAGPAYARSVMDDLKDKQPVTASLAPGQEVEIEFKSVGVVIMDIQREH